MSKEEQMNAAFNAGSDARIAGVPLVANPYENATEREFWSRGWRQVASQWAIDAKWPTITLPVMTALTGVA